LRFLRGYQKQAIAALQSAVQAGKDLFLFQMTTGTGKTSGMWDERLLVALYLPD
jgi:type I site-specific restriction endonuclease